MRHRNAVAVGGSVVFVGLLLGMLDVMTNQAITGIVMSMLSVPHVNPPPKSTAEKRIPTSPVALFNQIEWKEGEPHDVDMHVQCETTIPGGQLVTATVNYRQLQDVWLRLSKDDQGRPTTLNIEKVESISDIQKVPPLTKCLVNAHLYNTHGGALPITGKLISIHLKDNPTGEETIGIVVFSLTEAGQEITLLEFRWDKNGVLEKDSVKAYPEIKTTAIATAPTLAPVTTTPRVTPPGGWNDVW